MTLEFLVTYTLKQMLHCAFSCLTSFLSNLNLLYGWSFLLRCFVHSGPLVILGVVAVVVVATITVCGEDDGSGVAAFCAGESMSLQC